MIDCHFTKLKMCNHCLFKMGRDQQQRRYRKADLQETLFARQHGESLNGYTESLRELFKDTIKA